MNFLKKLFCKKPAGSKVGEISVEISCILNNDDLLALYPGYVLVKSASLGFCDALNSADFWAGKSPVKAILWYGAFEPEIYQRGLIDPEQEYALGLRVSNIYKSFCADGRLPVVAFVGVPDGHEKAVSIELFRYGYGNVGVYSTESMFEIRQPTGCSPDASAKIMEIVSRHVSTCRQPAPETYAEEAVVARMDSLANCIIDSIKTGEGGVAECTITGTRWTIPASIRPKAAKLRAENETLKELLAEANGKLLTIRETL